MNLPEDKSWVLLANYYDATLLRNSLALYMGNEMSILDWTPHYQYVDLMLNGQYKGIYQLGEKVKISKNRVNVGDNGFLMELDYRALTEEDARYFNLVHMNCPVNIKDPEVEYNDDDYNYAKDFVLSAETALYSENFTDLEEGWQKYIDMDSFVEWYLINEISKNADACALYSSCYMNLKRGGKLKMGPLWDFDLGFGGYPSSWSEETSTWANNPEGAGFDLSGTSWFSRLFQDPLFVSKVKERFNYFYNNRNLLYERIDTNASIINNKIEEENKLWGRLGDVSLTPTEVQSLYQDKVTSLKTWISLRLEWMNTYINSL